MKTRAPPHKIREQRNRRVSDRAMHWSVHLVIRIGVSFLRDILLCGLRLLVGFGKNAVEELSPYLADQWTVDLKKNNNNISKELNCILQTSIRRQNCPIITCYKSNEPVDQVGLQTNRIQLTKLVWIWIRFEPNWFNLFQNKLILNRINCELQIFRIELRTTNFFDSPSYTDSLCIRFFLAKQNSHGFLLSFMNSHWWIMSQLKILLPFTLLDWLTSWHGPSQMKLIPLLICYATQTFFYYKLSLY